MTRPTLAVFTRDRHTGSMKELTSGESTRYTLARDDGGPPHLRVLVADDHEAERQLTIQQLGEAWPFARDLVVESVTDGAAALRKIRLHQYACVMLDWNLPLAAGADVLQTIRTEGRRVPVVVLATQPRAAIAADLESLAAAYLNKSELNPTRICNALAAAILLPQRVFGLVKTDPIRIRENFPAALPVASFVRRTPPSYVRPTALVELR